METSSSIGTATLVVYGLLNYVEYSQQEGFYRVPLPAARQTSNLEDQWFRTFQLSPPGVPHVWKDASEPQQREIVENFAESGDFHVTFGFFYMP